LERKQVLESIEELKLFEADYREQLRRYIEDQLITLTREEASAIDAPTIESAPVAPVAPVAPIDQGDGDSKGEGR
jgi:hypothetical protein